MHMHSNQMRNQRLEAMVEAAQSWPRSQADHSMDEKIAIASLACLFVFVLLIGVWIGADVEGIDKCQKYHSYVVCVSSIEP